MQLLYSFQNSDLSFASQHCAGLQRKYDVSVLERTLDDGKLMRGGVGRSSSSWTWAALSNSSCALLHKTKDHEYYLPLPSDTQQSLKQRDVAAMSGCPVKHCKRLAHSRMLLGGEEWGFLPSPHSTTPFPTILCLLISPLRDITLYDSVKETNSCTLLTLTPALQRNCKTKWLPISFRLPNSK